MRILFLSTDFPTPWEPGRAPFNFQLVRALRSKHDVRVIAPVPWVKRLRPRKQSPAVATSHPTYFYSPKLFRRRYDWFYWQSIRQEVRRQLRDFTPDIVLAYWVHPDGAVAARIAGECGARSGIIVGGSDVLVLPLDPKRRGSIIDALNRTDHVFTVSDDLRRAVIALGIDGQKVSTRRQGINRDVFHAGDRSDARARCGIAPTTRALLWVGRMERVKGLDVLLRALVRVRRQCPNVRLYLIGAGSQRRALEMQAGQLKLGDAVKFVGPVSSDALGDWYRAADLTVLPSRLEGLPNVLRESLACGTPFVASRVGSIDEIARAEFDRLVAPEHPDQLADAVVEALRTSPNRSAGEFHTWEQYADLLIGTFASNRRAAPATAITLDAVAALPA